MKRLKNQKGAISVFVILAMLFFLAFMLGVYSITTKRNAAQLEAARETIKIYSMGVDANTVYDSLLAVNTGSVIPISTLEHLQTLQKITEIPGESEVNYTINGKLYTYKKYEEPIDNTKEPNVTYILNNDIILDLETEVNGNQKNFKFYDYMLYDKENYNINLNNHNIYYKFTKDKKEYDPDYELDAGDNSLWKLVFYQNNYKSDADFDSDTNVIDTGTENNFINVSKDNARKNFTSLNTRLYSILDGGLSSYKINNGMNYEFLLTYNCAENEEFDITHGVYNRWLQTNDPTKEIDPNSSIEAKVSGYSSVHIGLTDESLEETAKDYWGGLVTATEDSCYLKGSVGYNSWYYVVGTCSNWGKRGTPVSSYIGGYKAFDSASQTLLFVRVK